MAPGTSLVKTIFPRTRVGGRWFQDDSSDYIYYAIADVTEGKAQVVMPATERAINTDEALLTRPALTSCSAAQFLTGH